MPEFCTEYRCEVLKVVTVIRFTIRVKDYQEKLIPEGRWFESGQKKYF